MSAVLQLDQLTLSYGGLKVLRGISFEISGGRVFGLIGPNGAGKTSLLNCISRVQRPTSGGISFNGQSLLNQPMHQLPGLGITRSFQNLELFDEATVLDNVLVGCSLFHRKGLIAELLRLPSARQAHAKALEEAWELIDRLDLRDVALKRVADLPFGTRKAVEFARALAGRPRLLLLDEPAAGLNPAESQDLGVKLRTLAREQGTTVLMVEHDMPLVMNFCDRVIALVHGEIVCDGTPAEVRENETVVAAYLGVEADDA